MQGLRDVQGARGRGAAVGLAALALAGAGWPRPAAAFVEVTREEAPARPVARPVPGATDAGGGTARPEPRRESGAHRPLSLAANRVAVTIRDDVAVVSVEHVLQSNVDRILQARYVLPLGPRAHVSGYAIWEAGERVVGELMEVSRAEALYRQVTDQELTSRPEAAQEVRKVEVARDPGILRQMAPGSFETHVYPLLPWALKQVEVHWAEALEARDGWRTWSFPLEAARAFGAPVGEVAFDVDLGDSAGVTDVECAWPGATVERTPRGARVRLLAHEVEPTGPFVVRWRGGPGPLAATALAHRAAPGSSAAGAGAMTHDGAGGAAGPANAPDDGFALVRVGLPAAPDAGGVDRPLDVVLLVDRSGSARGAKARRQVEALAALVDALGPADRVAALEFAGGVGPAPEEAGGGALRAPEPGLRAGLRAWLDRPGPRGPTALAPALRAAFATAGPATPGRGRVVVLASDGVTCEDPDAVLGAVEPTGARLLALGTGHDDDAALLLGLAERHGGALWLAGHGERLERWTPTPPDALQRAYGEALAGPDGLDPRAALAALRAPAVTGLTLSAGGPQSPEDARRAQAAARLVDARPIAPAWAWSPGGTASFLVRYAGHGALPLRLRARVEGAPVDAEVALTLPAHEPAHGFVRSFWARARALELLREHPSGPRDPHRDEVIALSLAHRFMTPYTAFLSIPDAERRRVLLGPSPPDDAGDAYEFAATAGGAPEAEVWALLAVGLAVALLLARRGAPGASGSAAGPAVGAPA